MDFSRFFIDRPIFAAVLSILIFITGLIAIPLLPVSEYPDVVPPSVQVRAEYPGANPKVIAETVATPLEEAINGVENMMYMKSVAGSDGVLVTTVTFRPGTDPDQAQVQVQNRVAQAEARLPEDVRRLGITTQKQSPTLTLVVHLFSPNGKYDSLYMRNYATLKVKDELARLPGVGQIQIFGSGEYAMRVWLDPNKVAARGLTASDVVTAMQEQNVQVSAGQLGAEPLPQESDFLISINAQGRLHTEEEFGNIILKTAQDGSLVRLRDVARIEMGSGSYALRSQLNNKDAVGIGIFQSPGANAIDLSNAVRAKMAELATRFPEDMQWAAPYDPTVFVRDSIRAVVQTLLEAVVLVVLVVILFLQTWRASIIPVRQFSALSAAPFAAEPVAGGGDGAGDPCRTGSERTGGALADEPPAVGDNLWPPRGGAEAAGSGVCRLVSPSCDGVSGSSCAAYRLPDQHRCRRLVDHRLAAVAGGAGLSRYPLVAAGESDSQPHRAPLGRLGIDPALPGA